MEPLNTHDAIKGVIAATDAAEVAATRLQMKTEAVALDSVADDAKNIVDHVRDVVEDMKDGLNKGPVESDEHAAKVRAAAISVEAELAAMATELEKTTVDATQNAQSSSKTTETIKQGENVEDEAPNFKSTEQAVRELEALAAWKARRSIPGRTVVLALWGAWMALALVMVLSIRSLRGWELVWSGTLGLLWGIGATAVYYLNRRWKNERAQRLAMIPGAKGIQQLVHQIPSWISFSETEKMEWLNKIVAKAWPYYDAAICEEVKRQVEPMMEQYRPSFIKRIYFKKLTFGDAPFRIEGIRIDKQEKDRILMEMDFRWAGDANIYLAIELPAGGSATRMVPKVSNLAVSGTARIILAPLLPEIPGFGAVIASLMKPPVVKFHLNFGAALGGSYAASAVRAWLDPFLRSTVAGMLVWPRRVVVPILSEEVTGPLDDLYLRHKGALQVDVISATDIPRMDTLGKTDAYVEMYTMPHLIEKTSVKKNTLMPVWNERLWMLVQEPESQDAYITVNDVDMINVTEVFRLNIFKGASNIFQAKDLIGRAKLRVAEFASPPSQPVDIVVPLGMEDFSNDDGCGGGRGELKLQVTYWPLGMIRGHADAPIGALVVTVLRCTDIAHNNMLINTLDPYVKLTCHGLTKKTEIQYGTADPKWAGANFDWFKVPKGSRLEVEVMDYNRVVPDQRMGRLSIDVHEEVACARHGNVTKSWALVDVPPERLLIFSGQIKPSTVTMRIQWIPFQGAYDAELVRKGRHRHP